MCGVNNKKSPINGKNIDLNENSGFSVIRICFLWITNQKFVFLISKYIS